jgi:hypothetical protein
MAETATPLVLVTQNEGNVVDLYETVAGEADIIFIDWEEVVSIMEEPLQFGFDYLEGVAKDIARLRGIKGSAARVTVKSWDDLCEENDIDPATGVPVGWDDETGEIVK